MQENESVTKPVGDGIAPRDFLGAWRGLGTGWLWSIVGGVPTSK